MKKMNAVRLLLISCISGAVLFAGCSRAVDGKPEDGARWLVMYRCSGCHGSNGDDGKGPSLRPMKRSFSSFKRKIRASGSSIMPSYNKEKIPDQDIADMYMFLLSEKP